MYQNLFAFDKPSFYLLGWMVLILVLCRNRVPLLNQDFTGFLFQKSLQDVYEHVPGDWEIPASSGGNQMQAPGLEVEEVHI